MSSVYIFIYIYIERERERERKRESIFGGYCNEQRRKVTRDDFYGDEECFVFSVKPEAKVSSIYRERDERERERMRERKREREYFWWLL